MTHSRRILEFVSRSPGPVEPKAIKEALSDIKPGTISATLFRLVDQGELFSYRGRYFVPSVHARFAEEVAGSLLRGARQSVEPVGPRSFTDRGPTEGAASILASTGGATGLIGGSVRPEESGGEAAGIAGGTATATEAVILGATFTLFGEERITVDLLIRGPSERLVRSFLDRADRPSE